MALRRHDCPEPVRVVQAGRPAPLGVTLDRDGVNIAVYSSTATAMTLCLFDDEGQTEVERIPLLHRTGDVFHAHVAGIGAGRRYGLRADGPWAPRDGHRFNPAKLLVDPYATRLDRPFQLDPRLFDVPPGTEPADRPEPADTAHLVPKAIVEAPPEPAPRGLAPEPAKTVIYEMHVRGFTRNHPDIPDEIAGTFAGLAHPAAIDHLKALGVTVVELMPSMAILDERHLPPLGLTNYWGYNPITYLAPDPRLAPGGFAEIRAAVAALHEAGIAVILDVVFNHTGEGDHWGPTVSMRGLDNAGYYRLVPGEPLYYVNDTGCGNTLPLDRPEGLKLALEAMRTWVLRTGIDGFRFDLAVTLARRDDGFDPAAPFLAAVEQDPLLSTLIMIAEPWDPGPGGYHLGAFPARWGEWNDRYRDAVRRFWRGDGRMVGELATRFAGSADIFAERRRPVSASVNFITAHDGFTLADLVSYTEKHNEANGEFNRDGTGENHSWNYGVEGPTDDRGIEAERHADRRALLATLLFSRGTPMLSMGDECGRSQGGNNNAYAQDNAASWLDWENHDAVLSRFAARLVAARLAHPALGATRPLTGSALDASGIPDVAWLSVRGTPLDDDGWNDPANHTLIAALYEPSDGVAEASRVVVALHAGRQPVEIVLPEPRPGFEWICAIDSARPGYAGEEALDGRCRLGPRSVVLTAERARKARKRGAADPAVLDRLAGAAGLSPYWWDVGGTQHRVGDDSKRALLAALRLPAATTAEAYDSLERLVAGRELAALPPVMVVRAGEHATVTLGGRSALGERTFALSIEREDGSRETVVVTHDAGQRRWDRLPDGRQVPVRIIELPPQPVGRHVLRLTEEPETSCPLIVVPGRCYLPPGFAAGERRFGIAAHLYTLHRDGDQGIGDFTALGLFGALAASRGAQTIGLNPLHALFPTERDRNSPYHPSDRRFLDPIYIDVSALPKVGYDGRVRAALEAEAAAFGALAGLPAVDYPGVWAAKRRVLEAAFAAFTAREAAAPDDPHVADFQRFRHTRGAALQRFATFETLTEANGTPQWWTWPADVGSPAAAGVASFAEAHAERIRFSLYMQWVADRQLASAAKEARDAGLGLGFYRDLAVGTAPDGAEAWSEQDLLMTGVSVGAPPDPFSADGQIWNLPPPNPLAWAREGYRSFSDLASANMRHAGALRIDHVMGLTRLFLVPDGAKAGEGTYLAYPFHDLVGLLSLESQRAECLVVGEDLGTVPEGIGEALMAADVLSYRVLWFERDGVEFRPPERYPVRAAACVSTHDLPTLAGWWSGADIAERLALGLIDGDAAAIARDERQEAKAALARRLAAERLIEDATGGALAASDTLTPDLAAAVHRLVAATPSLIALVQADDLACERDAVNLPGTVDQRPNWRRKLTPGIDAVFTSPTAEAIMAAMAERLPGRTE